MFKNFIFAVALVVAATVGAKAENEVYGVIVNDLSYKTPDGKTTAGEVVGTVLDALAGTASNTSHPELAPAVNATVREAFSGVRRLAPVLGNAQFAITGDITMISTTTSSNTYSEKDKKGKEHTTVYNEYRSSVGVTLTLTDLETGQQWTNSFVGETPWYSADSNEAGAFDSANHELYKNIVKCYNSMFPLEANIIERGEEKKDKLKDCYIDLGDSNGLQKGMHFNVMQLGMVAGKETRKQIGKLKVEEVLGDDISRCKVDKGSKEIKAALDAGETLLIISAD